jgi:hypothetical protein
MLKPNAKKVAKHEELEILTREFLSNGGVIIRAVTKTPKRYKKRGSFIDRVTKVKA